MLEFTFLPSLGNFLVHKELRTTGLHIKNSLRWDHHFSNGLSNASQHGRISPLALRCIEMFLFANNYMTVTIFSLKAYLIYFHFLWNTYLYYLIDCVFFFFNVCFTVISLSCHIFPKRMSGGLIQYKGSQNYNVGS